MDSKVKQESRTSGERQNYKNVVLKFKVFSNIIKVFMNGDQSDLNLLMPGSW